MGYEQFRIDEPSMPGAWPRRSARISLDAEVSLRRPGRTTYKVKVQDASPHGCRVEFVERPALAERAWIKFEGLDGGAAAHGRLELVLGEALSGSGQETQIDALLEAAAPGDGRPVLGEWLPHGGETVALQTETMTSGWEGGGGHAFPVGHLAMAELMIVHPDIQLPA